MSGVGITLTLQVPGEKWPIHELCSTKEKERKNTHTHFTVCAGGGGGDSPLYTSVLQRWWEHFPSSFCECVPPPCLSVFREHICAFSSLLFTSIIVFGPFFS